MNEKPGTGINISSNLVWRKYRKMRQFMLQYKEGQFLCAFSTGFERKKWCFDHKGCPDQ
ncbi:MAG: hypothetical protein IKN04_21915 [Clostridia bacterium]|nr:hypothetical protein [Clostridia bacterium]